jgi:hypothetical protein
MGGLLIVGIIVFILLIFIGVYVALYNGDDDSDIVTAPTIVGQITMAAISKEDKCSDGHHRIDGVCIKIEPITCDDGYTLIDDKCVVIPVVCAAGQTLINDVCVTSPLVCAAGQTLIDDKCITIPLPCMGDAIRIDGKCVTPPLVCAAGHHIINNTCVKIEPITCDDGYTRINGECVITPLICDKYDYYKRGGKCAHLPAPLNAHAVRPSKILTNTSNSSFQVSRSSAMSAETEAYNMIGHDDRLWISSNGTYNSNGIANNKHAFNGINGEWVKFSLEQPVILSGYIIEFLGNESMPVDWTILTSMDNKTWSIATMISGNQKHTSEMFWFAHNTDTSWVSNGNVICKYITIIITKNKGAGYTNISSLNLR